MASSCVYIYIYICIWHLYSRAPAVYHTTLVSECHIPQEAIVQLACILIRVYQTIVANYTCTMVCLWEWYKPYKPHKLVATKTKPIFLATQFRFEWVPCD